MSCRPTTRLESDLPIIVDLQEQLTIEDGNRVLDSIARHEAMRALLAFSELHGQIRIRLDSNCDEPAKNLLETERFILDEVLQLICDRALLITKANSVVIALAQHSDSKKVEMVCRAAAGSLAIARGARLIAESELLREGMESGGILRCDDGESDNRIALDFAHQLGARSTVLVPLRGRNQQIGVLQAFSIEAHAFSGSDVNGLELLAELVLSALKPEDQDRRIHWLSDIAAEVLQPTAPIEVIEEPIILQAETEPQPETTAGVVEAADVTVIEEAISSLTDSVAAPAVSTAPLPENEKVHPEIFVSTGVDPFENILSDTSDVLSPTAEAQPSPVPAAEPEQLMLLQLEEIAPANGDAQNLISSSEADREMQSGSKVDLATAASSPSNTSIFGLINRNLGTGRSRIGLKLAMAGVVIASLFSAGVWWGTHSHSGGQETAAGNANFNTLPQAVTAPAPPRTDLPMPVADNLMSSAKVDTASQSEAPVGSEKLAALPKVTGLRHWSSSLGSTVVIDMEDQVPYEVHRLMSPERIYFDLHDTVLSHELDGKTMDVGDVALSRVRIAQPVAGLTRIVLDTKDGSNFSVSMEANPYRLVVELRGDKGSGGNHSAAIRNGAQAALGKTAAQAAAAANVSAPVSKPAVPEQLSLKSPSDFSAAKTGKFRIVLDAGHGGWDLGTVGKQGLLEKDLVLDVTQRLGKLLQSRIGAEVKFTRDSDEYLPLEQRSDLANQSQADLFVSIHANYSSSASARGVETYYSDLFAAPGSKESEKLQDGSGAKLTPVSLSLGGLHEKIEESRKLAVSVQRSLYSTLAANSPEIRNRGIKDSAFVVLTGTTMPSILTEISFVSSPEDERKLQSATYRQQIAEALFQGISRYRQSTPHVKLAQLQTATVRR